MTSRLCFYTLLLLHPSLVIGDEGVAKGQGDRLAYLDESGPYSPNLQFPKLTTPMWIGQKGVEAAVLLSIDDMRDPDAYERYLRPLLERLKQIDGRAPVSIFTCRVVPDAAQLQQFLREGLSLEIHTVSHPCPLFRAPENLTVSDDSLALVRNDYVPCIENLAAVAGNQPVAFRMPCCDSLNTNSPRFYSEIFPLKTSAGQFLSVSSSVFVVLTPKDPALPRSIVYDPEGGERFRKYIPFRNYAGVIEDYPYPYVVGRIAWEFPSIVPSDWSAQRLHRPDNPKTVEDWLAALDGVVAKQGLYTLVFHPHNWIKPAQLVELVDTATSKHGDKIVFLNFREALDRMTKNLLAGHPLRAPSGADNGVRLLDVNNDGYLDVVIANDQEQVTRLWQNETQTWKVIPFPLSLVRGDGTTTGARFFTVPRSAFAGVYVEDGEVSGMWQFDGNAWTRLSGFEVGPEGQEPRTIAAGIDTGLRFRDIDGDGTDECLGGADVGNAVYCFTPGGGWTNAGFTLPEGCSLVDAAGRDNGVRLVDLDHDGDLDLVRSNLKGYAVHRFGNCADGWGAAVRQGDASEKGRIPPLAIQGRPSGAWFFEKALYLANEYTAKNPDLIEKATFAELLSPTGTADR